MYVCMHVCTKSFLKTTTNSSCVCTHLANKADSDSDSDSDLPFPLRNIALFTRFAYGFIFRHYKITIITFKNLFFVKVQHCFVLKYEVARVFNSSDPLESHNIIIWIQNGNFKQKVASLYPCLHPSHFLSNVNHTPIHKCGVSFSFFFWAIVILRNELILITLLS